MLCTTERIQSSGKSASEFCEFHLHVERLFSLQFQDIFIAAKFVLVVYNLNAIFAFRNAFSRPCLSQQVPFFLDNFYPHFLQIYPKRIRSVGLP